MSVLEDDLLYTQLAMPSKAKPRYVSCWQKVFFPDKASMTNNLRIACTGGFVRSCTALFPARLMHVMHVSPSGRKV